MFVNGTVDNHFQFTGSGVIFRLHTSCWTHFNGLLNSPVMFGNVLGRLVTETVRVRRYAPLIQRTAPAAVFFRSLTDVKEEVQQAFDTSLLDFLVCPLSKKPLR